MHRDKIHCSISKGDWKWFLGDLVGGLERECKKREYSFLLQYVEEQEDEVDAAIRIAKEKKPSGMVFLGGDFSHPEQKWSSWIFLLC